MTNEMIEDLMEEIKKSNHLKALCLSEFDFEGMTTREEIYEFIQERINEHEIIYYHNAIEYLSQNDPSLRDSLSLARDCGFELDSLSSELLATLLFQAKANEELSDIFCDLD